MKRLLANTYNKFRNRIDHDIDRLVNAENIVRYGDHYIYGALMNRDGVAIDLGANKGHFAAQIADAFRPTIYLVEANPDLLDNINIPGAVKVNAAITSSNSEMTFYVSRNPEASSLDKSMAAQYGIIEERPVECITFSNLLSKYNISRVDLLKIDIEGAELNLLANMNDEEILKCRQIAIEFHDFVMPETVTEVKAAAQRVVNLGFVQLKFSPLDWRRVLFVQKSAFSLNPSFFRKFKSQMRSSRILDFSYYRVMLGMKKLLKGK
jgi:FkbM family methyltransferase